MTIESKITDIRSEDRLLLCCARTTIEKKTAEKINNLLSHNIDWAYLIQSAIHHRVVPLLYRALRQHFLNCVPTAILNELQYHYESIVRRNLFLTARLLHLINLLETHHISAIPYKGPALALLAYGNIDCRQFGDLDILVCPSDYLSTRNLLLACGYRLATDYSWECSLVDDKGVAVDLHRGLVPERFPTYLNVKSLQNRLEVLPIAGGKIKTFSPEDMLLILCIQLTKDAWIPNYPILLSKICDIRELLHTHFSMDWEQVLKEARRMGCQRMLFFSLSVARELLEAPVPEILLKSLTHPHLDILTKYTCNKLIRKTVSGECEHLKMDSFHFMIRERWRDKLYPQYHDFKLRLIPNDLDYAFLSLPESLNILYYVVRPIRLVRDYSQFAWHTLKAK